MSWWFKLNSSKAFGPGTTLKEKEQLRKYLQYETTRGVRHKFPRRADVSPYFGMRWQMDIADLGGSAAFNIPAAEKRPERYVLLVVDMFSRYLFGRALSNKQGVGVVAALDDILSNLKPPFPKSPFMIESDAGGEFRNAKVKAWMKEKNITHRFTQGKHKNEAVERAIRSFKKIAVPFLESNPLGFKVWPQTVKKIVNVLNQRKNRNLGMSPNQSLFQWRDLQRTVLKRLNITPFKEYIELQKSLTKKESIKDGSKKFHLGQWVLPARDKKNYEKETKRNFSYQPWQITSIDVDRKPFLYHLRNAEGKTANRVYYGIELRPLKQNPLEGNVPIKEILEERTNRGRPQWLVNFVDHDSHFNKWISPRKNALTPPKKQKLKMPSVTPSPRRKESI